MRDLDTDDLGRALLDWIGDDDRVRLVHQTREEIPNAANITVTASGVEFASVFERGSGAFMLAHDIGHFLAATDAELFRPNIGLSFEDSRSESSARNEELTLAYQSRLIYSLVDKASKAAHASKMLKARKVLRSVTGLDIERSESLEAGLDVRAEWDRKLALIAQPVMA